MLSLLAFSATAFSPQVNGGIERNVVPAMARPAFGLAGTTAAAMSAMLPASAWAMGDTTNYIAEFAGDDEEQTQKILILVSLIIVFSPIFGIKAAQGAISKMNEGPDSIDLSANDPGKKRGGW